MAKIKNNFLKATVNKDFDERLTPNGQMTDAENVMVISEDGGGVGVLKNVKGNLKVSSLNIAGSETIGSISDDGKNRCFYFVTSPGYDYVIQFNLSDNTTEIVLQSTHGTGVLNFDSAYRISHSDIFTSVEGDDLLSWTDGLNPPRIVNIERAKTYGVNGFTEDEISVMKPSPIYAPVITLQATSTIETTNFFEDKFLQFAYRYKYEDGYYSAFSSWSQVAFLPSSFQLDYQTYENNGMVNLANTIVINFNVGSRHVIGIDLLFKESDSSTVYVIDKLLKSEEGWNIENQQVSYSFYGNKIYSVLPESEYFLNFDNVPLRAYTQAKIGNRLIYGNYIEGRDINEKVKLQVDYKSTSLVLDEKEGEINNVVDTAILYSNVVDFEFKTEEGGSAPVDEMDYTTNTIVVDRATDFPLSTNIDLIIKVSPKGLYFSNIYSVYIKNGSTTLFSTLNVSGEQNITYTMPISSGTIYNLQAYVVSDDGLIYDFDLDYNAYYIAIAKIYQSKYKYYAYDQLSYPKSGGYDSTLVGDTIINYSVDFDFTDFDFTSGSQMRFDFELQSSLVYEVAPEFTYFYNLTESYTDLADFMTNSGFVLDFEGAFSTAFYSGANIKASNAGATITSVKPFRATYSGNTLTITSIYIQYLVTEDSGITEDKDDFYLIRSLNFGLYSEDAFASMHSNRDYTCDIIYLDDKGRKTTVLSGGNTSVYIPTSESENVNKIRVTTISNPPSWAKYYKFAIKETKREYDTIYGNVVYEDGIYRWIQLVGENKNKVKEGDILELKSDYSGVVENPIQVKVLEVTTQSKDFLPDNETVGGDPIVESSGLYFKIKQGAFDVNIDGNTFVKYEGFLKRRYARGDKVYTSPLFGSYDETDPSIFIPTPVKNGSQIRFFARMYMFKNGAFDQSVEIIKFAEDDYPSIKAWWEAEIADNQSWLNFAADRLQDYDWDGEKRFYIASNRNGTARSDVRVNIVFDVKFSSGTLIFENYKAENLNAPYYESVETYNVVNGQHFSGSISQPNVHVLNKTFNCFTFGNGCESNAIKDSFNGKKFYLNSNPTSITENQYRQIHRYADLTYSGVYQEGTNINKLNRFNLSLANYKDDLEKKYGSIIRLDSDATDLLVIQEDKWSKVLYGKDLLYNADATTNLSRIEDVLGQQVMYGGEYGISSFADSYNEYATNSFATDVKRGVVLRYNESNGLSEISSFGMKEYFKTLFRDNQILNTIGGYDPFYDLYVLNIKYKIPGKDYTSLPVKHDYVTWTFSDEAQGFLGKQSFNPDSMLKVNNEFLSFKGADVYKHNIGVYNTFYGALNPSYFEFNFNEEPSTRKIFKNVSIEGNSPWNTTLRTDMQNGIIYSADYVNKEGVQYAYIRGNNSLDFSTISVFGLGEVQGISGNDYTLSEIPNQLSVGDTIHIATGAVFGTVSAIGSDFVTISVVPGLPFVVGVGTFLLASKPSNIETSGIRGYYMNCRMELNTNSYLEVFAVNSEVSKSFE
jgi:hypothetical protein